jgi:hypothetical protein
MFRVMYFWSMVGPKVSATNFSASLDRLAENVDSSSQK